MDLCHLGSPDHYRKWREVASQTEAGMQAWRTGEDAAQSCIMRDRNGPGTLREVGDRKLYAVQLAGR